MRKIVFGLLLAGLFLMLFVPSAFAYEEPQPEGQVIMEKSYIGLAYFQVWQHSDGRWQDTDLEGGPDKPGQVKTWDYKAGNLESLADQYDLTGVRVLFPSVNERSQWQSFYEMYGGYKGLPFDTFYDQILKYSAAKCEEGKVWAEEHFPDDWTYTLHYDGIRLAIQPGVSGEQLATEDAMDLKWPDNRAFVQSLGIPMNLPSGASFSEMAAGYIYWVPYIVEVYGTPDIVRTPDFSVKSFDPGCPKEPVQTASSDPGVIGLLAQSESYVAVPGEKYTATVVFRAEATEIDPETVFPAIASVAGLHKVGNVWYPSELRAVDVPEKAFFLDRREYGGIGVSDYEIYFGDNGLEVKVEFDWTAENAPETTLAVAINTNYPPEDPVITPVWWEDVSMELPMGTEFDPSMIHKVAQINYTWEGYSLPSHNNNLATVTVKMGAPDLYVKSLNPGTSETEPGMKYNGVVTFGLKDYSEPVQAKLELTHNDYGVSGVNNELYTFNPGEEKTFDFSFTGQDKDSVLVAKIRPVEISTDADWSNNSKQVTVPAAVRCTDISVNLTKTPPHDPQREGDDAMFKATVKRANDGPAGAVTVQTKITGPGINKTFTDALSRGGSKTHTWVVENLSPGSKTYKVTVTPVDVEDCAPGNNVDSITFSVRDVPEINIPDSEIHIELVG